MFVPILIFVLLVHLVADFLCQTRWMAENKSKSIFALTTHVGAYTIATLLLVLPLVLFNVPMLSVCAFVAINAVLHWATDYVTSKTSSYFWEKEDRYKFFATIGFDQYIHQVCLILTTYVFL